LSPNIIIHFYVLFAKIRFSPDTSDFLSGKGGRCPKIDKINGVFQSVFIHNSQNRRTDNIYYIKPTEDNNDKNHKKA